MMLLGRLERRRYDHLASTSTKRVEIARPKLCEAIKFAPLLQAKPDRADDLGHSGDPRLSSACRNQARYMGKTQRFTARTRVGRGFIG